MEKTREVATQVGEKGRVAIRRIGGPERVSVRRPLSSQSLRFANCIHGQLQVGSCAPDVCVVLEVGRDGDAGAAVCAGAADLAVRPAQATEPGRQSERCALEIQR